MSFILAEGSYPFIITAVTSLADQSFDDTPTIDEPIINEPTMDKSIIEDSTMDNPIINKPTIDEPMIGSSPIITSVTSLADQLIDDDEPPIDEPVIDSAVEITVISSLVDQPANDEIVFNETAKNKPVVDLLNELTSVSSLTDQSLVDEPIMDEPTINNEPSCSQIQITDITSLANQSLDDEPIVDSVPIITEVISLANNYVVDEPIINELTMEPIIEESTTESTVNKPTMETIVDAPTVELITDEPLTKPTVDEPMMDPIVDESTIEPTMEEPTVEATKNEPLLSSMIKITAVKSLIEEPLEDVPIMSESAADEPKNDSVADEPKNDSAPVITEVTSATDLFLDSEPTVEELTKTEPVICSSIAITTVSAQEDQPKNDPVVDESPVDEPTIGSLLEPTEVTSTVPPEEKSSNDLARDHETLEESIKLNTNENNSDPKMNLTDLKLKKALKTPSKNRILKIINKASHLRTVIPSSKIGRKKKKCIPLKMTFSNYKNPFASKTLKFSNKKQRKIINYKKIINLLKSSVKSEPLSSDLLEEKENENTEKNSDENVIAIESENAEAIVKGVIDGLIENVISVISNNIELETATNNQTDTNLSNDEFICDKIIDRLYSFEELDHQNNGNRTSLSESNTTEENKPMTIVQNKETLHTSDDLISNHSNSSSIISPEKTSDITKIKGWRNKQFLLPESIEELNLNIGELNSPSNDCDPKEVTTTEQIVFDLKDLNKLLPNEKKIKFEIPIISPIKNAPPSIQTKDIKRNSKDHRFNRDIKKLYRSTEVIKKFKAKTLAEKRQFLEMVRQKEIMHEVELNEAMIFKKLKRYENRDRFNTLTDIHRSLTEQTIPITRQCWMSTIELSKSHLVKDKGVLIRIGGSVGGDVINLNNSPPPTPEVGSNKIERKVHEIVFRPGPLSKKPTLSLNTNGSSHSVIMKLPQPYLEVRPDLNKSLHPLACQYLQNECENGIISTLWAEYSASALITEKGNKHFSFPLRYKNGQKNILMIRKKVYQVPSLKDLCKKVIKINSKTMFLQKPEKQIKHEVMMVLTDMLDYLDTPVLDNSNIPYCPDCPEFKETENKNIEPLPSDVHAVISATKKKNGASRKTELELKRLNVKVIEVELKQHVKEKVSNKGKCDKLECKLGCVCYDANVDFPEHCGRESCMLECQCRMNKTIDRFRERQIISLPEGSNILCSKTVGQLQERAKRNLAKEERKFTQTVIKANDQTIVVGEGCRERRRRTLKIPHKLRDYINSPAEIKNISGSHSSSDENDNSDDETHLKNLKIWDKSCTTMKKKREAENMENIKKLAFVHVRNMTELKDVIPWCMVHNLYKCFCEGKEVGPPTPVTPKKVQPDENKNVQEDFVVYNKGGTKRINRIDKTDKVENTPANHAAMPQYKTVELSARTRGVSSNYLQRNKTNRFKIRVAKFAKDLEQKLEQSSNSSTKLNKKSTSPATATSSLAETATGETEPPKTITFRYEPHMLSSECETITKKLASKYLPDLIIPYPHIQQHLRMVVFKGSTSKHIFRLMLWDNLVKHYHETNVFIWYNPNSESGKLVATISKTDRPSKSFIDIRFLKNKDSKDLPNPAFCLLNNSSPGKKEDRKLTFVIFVFNGAYWELRCCIIQKPTDAPYGYIIGSQTDADKPKVPETLGVELTEHSSTITDNPCIGSVKSSQAAEIIREMSTQLKTNEPTQRLTLESKEVPLTVARPDLVLKDSYSPSLRVPIPVGSKNSRWFMLILENDFSILRIMKYQHVLKYSQLKEACQVAFKFGKTVRFPLPRTKTAFSSGMPTYGLYAVPGLLERIFFGPYSLDEDHGIITYKYINGKLVNTKDIDLLYSPNEPKSKGIWLYTNGQEMSSNADDSNVTYVDLTANEEDTESLKETCKIKHEQQNNVITKTNKASELTNVQELSELKSLLMKDPTSTTSEQQNPLGCLKTYQRKTIESTSTDLQIIPENKIIIRKIPSGNISTEVKRPLKVIKTEEKSPMKTLSPDQKESLKGKNIDQNKSLERIKPAQKRSLESADQSGLLDVENTVFVVDSGDEDEQKANLKANIVPAKKIKLCDDIKCISSDMITSTTNSQDGNELLLPTKQKEDANTNGNDFWLVPEPLSLGYIKLKVLDDGSTTLINPVSGSISRFTSVKKTIQWVDSLLRKYLCFVPTNFQVKMFLVDNLQLFKLKQPLKEEMLRGFHMVCEAGVYDLEHVTSDLLHKLNLSIDELARISLKLNKIAFQKALYSLGASFIHPSQLRSIKKETVIQKAPQVIELLQKKNVHLKSEKRALIAQKHALLTKKQLMEMDCNIHGIKVKKGNSSLDIDNDVMIIEDITSSNKDTSAHGPSSKKQTLSSKNSLLKSKNLNPCQTNIENIKPKTTETSLNNSSLKILKHSLKIDEIEISPINSNEKQVINTVIQIPNGSNPTSSTTPNTKIDSLSQKDRSEVMKKVPLLVFSNGQTALVPNITKNQLAELIATKPNNRSAASINVPVAENSKILLNLPNVSLLKIRQPSIPRFILPAAKPDTSTAVDNSTEIIEID